jgi:hypothetical protein
MNPGLAGAIEAPYYFRVKSVSGFAELVATPFADGVNALCWPRVLSGDFGEVVEKLGPGEGIVPIEEEQLMALRVSDAGRISIELLREDLRRLREVERDPVLNCIHDYARERDPGPVTTDVYSFHTDSAPVEADTWLCTYHVRASEGLPNEQALRRVEVPQIRDQLRKFLGAERDDNEFCEMLREYGYDQHFAPLPGAQPYGFGVGNLWRIAVDWPGSAVPPCIHRAPERRPHDPPRLLLIC